MSTEQRVDRRRRAVRRRSRRSPAPPTVHHRARPRCPSPPPIAGRRAASRCRSPRRRARRAHGGVDAQRRAGGARTATALSIAGRDHLEVARVREHAGDARAGQLARAARPARAAPPPASPRSHMSLCGAGDAVRQPRRRSSAGSPVSAPSSTAPLRPRAATRQPSSVNQPVSIAARRRPARARRPPRRGPRGVPGRAARSRRPASRNVTAPLNPTAGPVEARARRMMYATIARGLPPGREHHAQPRGARARRGRGGRGRGDPVRTGRAASRPRPGRRRAARVPVWSLCCAPFGLDGPGCRLEDGTSW